MSINLEKGRSINLEKESGERLTNFCVGCNWGAVVNSTFFGLFKSTIDVDVDLSCLMFNAEVQSIVFFLNIYNNNEYSGDFSGIPYAHIRMFEGVPERAPRRVFAQYNVATQQNCEGMRALVMGKLYRVNGNWQFKAIGEAFPDRSIVHTVSRVMKDFAR